MLRYNHLLLLLYTALHLLDRKKLLDMRREVSSVIQIHITLFNSILLRFVLFVGLGNALADAGRPLVYGGGSKGIMGVVSGAALAKGGKVTGVIPFAMVVAGGEKEKKAKATLEALIALDETGTENVRSLFRRMNPFVDESFWGT